MVAITMVVIKMLEKLVILPVIVTVQFVVFF